MRQTVLCIDDCESTLELVGSLLRTDEVEVEGYTDPIKGVGAALRQVPDLVILDLQMPGSDGFQVASHIRKWPALAHVPILFLSASQNREERLEGLRLGAIDFILKPIQPDVFVARIRNALRLQEQVRELRRQRIARFIKTAQTHAGEAA